MQETPKRHSYRFSARPVQDLKHVLKQGIKHKKTPQTRSPHLQPNVLLVLQILKWQKRVITLSIVILGCCPVVFLFPPARIEALPYFIPAQSLYIWGWLVIGSLLCSSLWPGLQNRTTSLRCGCPFGLCVGIHPLEEYNEYQREGGEPNKDHQNLRSVTLHRVRLLFLTRMRKSVGFPLSSNQHQRAK